MTYKFNFVIPPITDTAIKELEEKSLGDFVNLFSRGEYCWGLLTYYHLRDSGLAIQISYNFKSDCINLAHGNVLRKAGYLPNYFCVSLQADFPHFSLANFHIVQNKNQISKNAEYVPLWPQPGLKTRTQERTEITTVGYQGASGFTDLNSEKLNTDIKPHGLQFLLLNEAQWSDLQTIDILVGVRSFSKLAYNRKPPSKLINAWHAKIPFIGGWDSAFSQVGKPGEDYLRISSYEELVTSIILLKKDQHLYNTLVEKGTYAAKSYTNEKIKQLWFEILNNEIAPSFEKWRDSKYRFIYSTIQFLFFTVGNTMRTYSRKLYSFSFFRFIRKRYWDPTK